MAVIREELVLVDRFSSVFAQYLNMGRQMAELLARLQSGQGGYNDTVRRSTEALERLAGSSQHTNELLEQLGGTLHEIRDRAGGAADQQDRVNRKFREGGSAAGGLIGRLKSLAAAYLGLRSAQKLVTLSDTWVQTTARLERMNDGRQTTPELQEDIFQAAQRSRGNYQDTANLVAKLGTLAGDAFNGSGEVVAFAEQINKQFALAGTSAQGAQAAMLQLTQAMGSGVLRGEELNSILEQAPTITKAIADYLGVSVGQMRQLASEGQITSDVVKNALFAAAEETNAAFAAVPLTFSQAWTMAKNEALNAFRPALERLNDMLNSDMGQRAFNGLIYTMRLAGSVLVWLMDLVESGAAFVAENWDAVSALLIGGAAAVAGAMVFSAVKTMIAWAAANWPLLLIAGTIAFVIYKARQMGATWEDICGFIGTQLYGLYALGHNLLADAWNLIATFAEFFANVFQHPVTAIANLLADLGDWALGIIESIASGIDAVFGSDLSNAVSGWRSGLKNWVKDTFGENEIKIQRMEHIDYGVAWENGRNFGGSIGKTLDDFNFDDYLGKFNDSSSNYAQYLDDAANTASALQDIGADTKAIRKSVSLSEEDLKMMVDLAKRDYVANVNLTAQTPIINVTGQNTGNTGLDRQLLAEAIRDILLEQAASHTALGYT